MRGLYFEEFTVGMHFEHALTRTVTEWDNVQFSTMTLNPQPLHIDAHYAAKTEFGRPLVNSLFTLGLMIGISVAETTLRTTIANLGMKDVLFPAPVFHGDTLHVTTEVDLAARKQVATRGRHRGVRPPRLEPGRGRGGALHALGLHAPFAEVIAARSWLFVPGDSARKIERALAGDADALILDWEDAVAPTAKAAAREATVAALDAARPLAARCWVRVNALASAHFAADLAALPAAALAGVVLPKACGPADLERLAQSLSAVEAGRRRPRGPPGHRRHRHRDRRVGAGAGRIPQAGGAARRLMWGGEDLAGDLGVARNRDTGGAYRAPFRLARSLTLLAAAATECIAIDAVRVDFRDAEALALECAEARADGFTAKAAIHPDQVGPINAAFAATAEERAWAGRVVAALHDGGLAVVDGRMVDAPHLRLARRILSS